MRHTKMTVLAAFAMANLLAIPAMSMTTTNLPPEKSEGMVSYLTGGIGEDEAAAMKQVESQFPLSLEFVSGGTLRGEYLADVHVTIKDQAGKTALDTVSDGPFLLARLPSGKYTVSAEQNGQTKTRQVVVADNKPQRLTFVWQE